MSPARGALRLGVFIVSALCLHFEIVSTFSSITLQLHFSHRGRFRGAFSASESSETIARDGLTEGKVSFESGECFYRSHSKVVRDLGVLSLLVHRERLEEGNKGKQGAEIRVLDAMCGAGIRTLRYITEGKADFVHANDANDDFRLAAAREKNLAEHVRGGQVKLTTGDAMDLYFGARLERNYFDLIDVDGFGTGAPHSSESVWALRQGGLLYLCATDARTAAGKNGAATALRGYGGVVGATPLCNEVGVRLVVADAVRQAAVRGMRVEPLWGFFHRQSSCVRVMLRLTAVGKPARGAGRLGEVGWIAYCSVTGNHWAVDMGGIHDPRAAQACPREATWRGLAAASVGPEEAGAGLAVVGPVWVGEVQDREELGRMGRAAEREGMTEAGRVVRSMADEAGLPVGYYRLRELGAWLGREGVGALPGKRALVAALRAEGFRAGGAAAEAQAIKTDASVAQIVATARRLRQKS